MDRSDLHAGKIAASVADLLRCLAREGDEGDLFGPGDSGLLGIAGFRDHRVGFAGPGAGDDEGAVFLGDDRPTLIFVQVRESRVCEALPEEALIVGSPARLGRRAEFAVEAPCLKGTGELPPALQGCGQSITIFLCVGVADPRSSVIVHVFCHFLRRVPCAAPCSPWSS